LLARVALFVVLLGLGLLPIGCGSDDDDGISSDPVGQCKDAAKATCAKFFGCFTSDELSLVAQLVGNNEADCITKFSADCNTEGVKCDSGETYSSSAGKECISQIKSLSCDEIKNPATATPAACDQTCQ
jgi:hypothetical protein